MAATGQNATIYRGGSYVLPITVLDVNEDPVDLTGKDVYYRVALAGWTDAILEIDSLDITVAGSVVSVALPSSITDPLEPRAYYHELYMVDADERYVLMTGFLTVLSAQAAQYDES